jgi:hypothetical protein
MQDADMLYRVVLSLLMVGGAVIVALGFAILVAATLAQVGIAFTDEPMIGIGLFTGPLAMVAGSLPLMTSLGLHRRSRPLAAAAIPTLLVNGPLGAASFFGAVHSLRAGAASDPLALVVVAGFAGAAFGALLTLVGWRSVLAEAPASAVGDD